MRLSIARAIYDDPDILLIDDCLAAVDGRVARNIFSKVFKGRAERSKTTIVVLNQLELLKEDCWSRVVFLSEKQGVSPAIGSFSELMRENISFRALMAAVSANKRNCVDDIGQKISYKKAKNLISSKQTKFLKPSLAAAESINPTASDTLFKDDLIATGSVDWATLYTFFKGLGGPFYIIIICFIGFCAYGLVGANDIWLAAWVTNPDSMSIANRCIGYAALSLGQAFFILMLSLYNA